MMSCRVSAETFGLAMGTTSRVNNIIAHKLHELLFDVKLVGKLAVWG
jgi:hypothetical protein